MPKKQSPSKSSSSSSSSSSSQTSTKSSKKAGAPEIDSSAHHQTRYERLQGVVDRMVSQALKEVDVTSMTECLPQVAKENSSLLPTIQPKVVNNLGGALKVCI
jgi:hypothetical protein